MKKFEQEKILKWIFDNHDHHIEYDQHHTAEPLVCEDYPYVNSIKLEKFIESFSCDDEYEPWVDENTGKIITHLPKPNQGEQVEKAG
jgi:hypothetical protein